MRSLVTKPSTSLTYEGKILRLALLIGLFPLALLSAALYFLPLSIYFKLLVFSLTLILVIYGAFEIRRLIVSQLRTATNLMEALTSGDFSLRACNQGEHSALNEFNDLLNGLANSMAQQSLVSKERQILLHKVIDHIDVAIIVIDHHQCISLINPAAEQLFDNKFAKLDGAPIKTLGLQEVVTNEFRQVVEFEIKQHRKKVYIHSDEYFDQGNKHRLIFITDIQDILRDEERHAWQRLLRVLSHEINNSLAPIASISESLHASSLQDSSVLEASDFQQGLAVISERSTHLNEFIQRYQKLTKLPAPQKSMVHVASLLANTVALFDDVQLKSMSDEMTCFFDESQMQQVLVNLIKNAQESGKQGNEVEVLGRRTPKNLELIVQDKGRGISNMDNIFVPFYTTKAAGSGIGLVLCRQIVRNHGGDLALKNRRDQQGVIATITLPIK